MVHLLPFLAHAVSITADFDIYNFDKVSINTIFASTNKSLFPEQWSLPSFDNINILIIFVRAFICPMKSRITYNIPGIFSILLNGFILLNLPLYFGCWKSCWKLCLLLYKASSCFILTLTFGFNEDFKNKPFSYDFILSKFKTLHTVSASLRSLSVISTPSNNLKVETASSSFNSYSIIVQKMFRFIKTSESWISAIHFVNGFIFE